MLGNDSPLESRRSVLRSAGLLALGAFILPRSYGRGQRDPEQTTPQIPIGQSGMRTGGVYAPVKDAKNRPITVGRFVDGAPVIFQDIIKQAVLDEFRHKSDGPEKATILEAEGSGVALLDYDDDGWLDIYLLNGPTFDALKGKQAPPRAMLLHNNHDGSVFL